MDVVEGRHIFFRILLCWDLLSVVSLAFCLPR
jgi:hypothetical protein